jgi:hypothetical protein
MPHPVKSDPARRPQQTAALTRALLALPLFLLAPQLLAADTPLPKATEIVEHYDQALGGRDAILRHTSSTMRGTVEIHQASATISLPFVYFAAAPYRRVEKVTLPNNMGENVNGVDGDIAWGIDPRTGPVVFSGDDLQSAKRDADFYYPLDELTWFKSMETVGVEDFEGRPCYRLHGVNNWNKSNDHLYDRETGLLAAYEFPSQLGLTREVFSDYQKQDGVLVSMKQTVKVKAKDGTWAVFQVITYSSYTFNDVDPAVFTPPQAVRDLLAKPKPAATP